MSFPRAFQTPTNRYPYRVNIASISRPYRVNFLGILMEIIVETYCASGQQLSRTIWNSTIMAYFKLPIDRTTNRSAIHYMSRKMRAETMHE